MCQRVLLRRRMKSHSIMIVIFLVSSLFLTTPFASSDSHPLQPPVNQKKCPTVKIKGPKKSKGLKTMSYRAQIKNASDGWRPVFTWSLVGGEIVEGQGTSSIKVEPIDSEVSVTLVVENIPSDCRSNSDSLVARITSIPVGCYLPPIVSSVYTSSSSITRPCSAGQKSESCTATDQVEVSANATDPDNDTLLYSWSVTAGRLRGAGRMVTWDLSGVAAGTYTITVEVDAGNQLKASGSAKVTVADCGDCKPERK